MSARAKETLADMVEEMATTLRRIHNSDAQRQFVHAKLVEVCGEEQAAKIIDNMPWRATTGWKQMLHLIKHGHLGYEPVTDSAEVAALTGAPLEAVSKALVTV